MNFLSYEKKKNEFLGKEIEWRFAGGKSVSLKKRKITRMNLDLISWDNEVDVCGNIWRTIIVNNNVKYMNNSKNMHLVGAIHIS